MENLWPYASAKTRYAKVMLYGNTENSKVIFVIQICIPVLKTELIKESFFGVFNPKFGKKSFLNLIETDLQNSNFCPLHGVIHHILLI